MTIKRGLIVLGVALVLLAACRWWISRQPTPPSEDAFTQVCAAPACSDDEAIYTLLRGKLGWFRQVPQVDRPLAACAPRGVIDVYRPAYTPDYRFALVWIIRDGGVTESYRLLFLRTEHGWAEVGPYGFRVQAYDCNFW
jgi:hypothetical protein